MGYHIKCNGAELLQLLNKNAYKLLDGPYALYIIVLATGIDEPTIDWIIQYESVIDSLTGPYAAFMVFYNEALLKTNICGPGYPDYEYAPHWLPQGQTETDYVKVKIEPKVLSAGTHQIDRFVRFNPKFCSDRKIILESTSYASDIISRELGISKELPCLLIFDDPSSRNFYTIPLTHPDKDTIKELRELLIEYAGDKRYVDYFEAIKSWYKYKSRLIYLKNALNNGYGFLAPQFAKNHDNLISELNLIKSLLITGNMYDYRKRFKGIFRDSMKFSEIISREDNKLTSAHSLLRRVLKTESASRAEITWLAEKAFHCTKDDSVLHADNLSLIREALTKFIPKQADIVMSSICLTLDAEYKDGRVFRVEWDTISQEINAIENLLQKQQEFIEKSPKPKFKSYAKAYRSRKRKKLVINEVTRIALKTSEDIPTLLEVLSKVMKLVMP